MAELPGTVTDSRPHITPVKVVGCPRRKQTGHRFPRWPVCFSPCHRRVVLCAYFPSRGVFLQNVPLCGTIPRCIHSHYAPDGDAYHCYLCNPVRPADQRPVVLPVDSSTPLNGYQRLRANRNDTIGMCPQCHSRVHFDLENGKHECAECGTVYAAAKKSITRQFREMVAAEHAELHATSRCL